MNRLRIATTLATLIAVFAVFLGPAGAVERTVTLKVEKMTCAACPYTVRKALERVKGVKTATVSYKEKTAVVTFDDELATLEDLTEATTRAGYPSSLLPAAASR